MTSSPLPPQRASWLIPLGLVLLAVVPSAAGTARLVELAKGAAITVDNARFFDAPLPAIIHIVAVIFFGVLGAFQFSSGIRSRHPQWHRVAGRLLVVCGLASSLTGLWLTQFYPYAEGDGDALYVTRLVVGVAMTIFILRGFTSIKARQYAQHRAWMMRGYGLGMGAGTQVFTHLPWVLLVGKPAGAARAVLMGAGWLINAALVEWLLRAPARQHRNAAKRT